MSSCFRLNSAFPEFNVAIEIDSDLPAPSGWDVLLPLEFGQSAGTEPDFFFHFNLLEKPIENSIGVRLPFHKKNRSVHWTQAGRRVSVNQGDQITIHIPFRSATICGKNRWLLLSELIESWIGWLAETRGFVRLHSLAVETGNSAAVLIARQGFGKTTLALSCVQKRIPVLAEEVVFIKGLSLHPVRTVLREKSADGEFHGSYGRRKLHFINRHPKSSLPLRFLSYGLRKPNRMWFAHCGFDITIGLGLPQNLDLTLFPFSFSCFAGWLRILRNRLNFLIQIRNVNCAPFERKSADTPLQTAGNWLYVAERLTK